MLNFNNFFEKIIYNSKLYWKGFTIVAFAFYDKEKVYLYNHPKVGPKNKPYRIIQRNNQFNGANTLIIYEDYPTAIVNLDLYNDKERMYAIVMHELFHGFQYLKKESRFPNEFLGMDYPLSKENVELRSMERNCLYKAVLSPLQDEKIDYITEFINIREKRKIYINEFLEYETAIETVEGPAFYIELQAYSHISSSKKDVIIHEYGDDLINIIESTFNIRKSCYSSGLFMCLLLDEVFPKWKEVLFKTDKSLYDLLKGTVDWEVNDTTNVEISMETNSVINAIRQKKQEIFTQFETSEGYHLLIAGDINCKGFDPMNVIKYENQLFHKNFLSILINEKEFNINQPVITHYDQKFSSVTTLHLVLDEEPVLKDGVIDIKGIGEIKGQYSVKEGLHYVSI